LTFLEKSDFMTDGKKSESNGFLVRDYRNGDYSQVCRLWEITGLGRPERGDDEATINKSLSIGGRLLVLEDKEKGAIAGTSWMTFDGRRIHLHHFGIDPALQGRKLSKILLKESLKHVKAMGCQVKLEVHSKNLKAINLYKKSGFDYLGDYDIYIIRDSDSIDTEKINQ